MKKTELKERLAPHLGKTPSDDDIADMLKITRQAVVAWGDKVPPLRVYQLRDLYPIVFPTREVV